MKKLKSLLTTLVLLLCSVSVSAHDFEVDGIYYNITSSQEPLTVEVTCQGSSYDEYSDEYTGSVLIPESVTYDSKTYSVTSIGDYAFFDCSKLTEVTIPESVTSIGKYAFTECASMTSINIPNSVKTIGEGTFLDCSKLTEVTILDGVTSIGAVAFYDCTGLSGITIPSSVTTIGQQAFYDCYFLSEKFINNSTLTDENNWGATIIENNEENNGLIIRDNVLIKGRGYLDKVNIPSGVTRIGDAAFVLCRSLTSVTIPTSVTTIGHGAFSECSSLPSIDIPNSVTSIGEGAFSGCRSLSSIIIPDSVTSISGYLFQHCTSLSSITIHESVTSIGKYAFFECSSLPSIKIPDGVTIIGEYAFTECTSLTTINIPNSVKTIGEGTFAHCSSLPSIKIPDGVTSIGKYAFQNCSSLPSITIPDGVTSIGEYAFTECASLASVYCLAENVPETASNCFTGANVENATLYVPASIIETYKATEPWCSFASIESLSVKIQMGENEISTFCSTYDLDFTDVSGLKAFIASGHNNNTGTVMMARVYDVPAGTGVILIGEAGNYMVPTATSASCYSNMLKGVTTATTITATSDGYNNYILANGDNGIGFYPVVAEGGTLAAGKAYLQLPSSVSSAKGFSMSFEDETTGIDENYELEIMNYDNTVYDLQGRKVKNPTKGLYIVNGKKVVF